MLAKISWQGLGSPVNTILQIYGESVMCLTGIVTQVSVQAWGSGVCVDIT